jgi:L-2,4-diaminobutyrate transaminase
MSAAVVSRGVWEVLSRESKGVFGHGFTYSAHPVAAAAGLANLDVIEREDLVGNARSVGGYLQMALRETFGSHPLVGEVRGVGLIAAVELAADRLRRRPFDPALRIGQRAMEAAAGEGMLVRGLGNAIALSPPLVIRESEIDELVERLRRAIERLAHALLAEGAWNPV